MVPFHCGVTLREWAFTASVLAANFFIMPALIFFAHVIMEPTSDWTAKAQATNLLLLQHLTYASQI